MPTIYELDYSWIDESLAQIQTTAIWQVWDCAAQSWSTKPKVTLRNTLLSGLHQDAGKERFCIGEIPTTTKDPSLLNPFVAGKDRYTLDLGSNSRNKGRFTFNLKPVGKDYYGTKTSDQWKRVIYGSILHTGCKLLAGREFNYIVVDHEHKDEQGNPQDDPTNGRHWNSGDSHAKASKEFMTILGTGDVHLESNPEVPLQFRIGCFKQWVAKGTVAYNPELDDSGFDLVIPLSSLKGNKPELGNYTEKLLCGLVFEGEKRTAKAGWMLFQWFAFETLEQDKIISRLRTKCEKLVAATNSIQALAKELRIHQEEAEQEREQGDSIQSEAEYINTAMEIIKYDLKGRLLLHPYITGKVAERLQTVWLNLAKAAGVRFWSLMSQPDEYFKKYEITDNNDKTIFIEKVFCAPSMDVGEYIVFCNPMRHWGDCQLWINRHEGTYANAINLMAASTKLMLNLGRDFDGDFVQLIASHQYPALRNAIANFDQPPSVEKLPKMALPGSLQEVAINSMNDSTGIVASLLGRARAAGAEGIVLNIPPGGMQTEAKEMSILGFLSQELQIAVDSLKSAYPNNDVGLKAVTEYIDSLGDAGKIPWLKDFKEKEVYLSRPCGVAEDAIDTISRIVKVVNSYWKPAQLETNIDINSFENALFVGVEVAREQTDFAFEQRKAYRIEMSAAIEWKEQNEGDTTKIREVSAKFQALKDSALEQFADAKGQPYTEKSWAAAYWRAVHTNASELSTGSLVFNLFREEILTELRENPDTLEWFDVYNVHKQNPNVWSRGEWTGQNVLVRIVQRLKPATGKQAARMELAVDMRYPESTKNIGYFPLGWVAEKYKSKVAIGETREMRIFTHPDGKGMDETGRIYTKRACLFNQSLTQDQIDSLLGNRPVGLYEPEDFGLPPN